MTKRRKVQGIILLISVLVGTAVVLAVRQWATQPTDGTVHTGTPATQTPTDTETPTERINVETAYFAARLPVGFTSKRQTATPNGLALLELVTTDKHQQLAVTIADLPREGLPGVGDYNLRVTDTAAYEPYRPAGMPVDAIAFRTLSGPPAFVAFWPNGTRYAEIALTSDSAASLLELFNSFAELTHTWQWR